MLKVETYPDRLYPTIIEDIDDDYPDDGPFEILSLKDSELIAIMPDLMKAYNEAVSRQSSNQSSPTG